MASTKRRCERDTGDSDAAQSGDYSDAAVAQWKRDVAAGIVPDPWALDPLVKGAAEGRRVAGIVATEVLGAHVGTELRFDLTNQMAVAWANNNAARLIVEISAETQAAVRQAVVRSMRGELTLQEVAKYVRGIVGLTAKQEQAVNAVYDKAIEQGVSAADALAESQGYAETLRKYRSEVIARSEVLRASNAGQRLIWQQGKAAGLLQGMEQIWIATKDDRLCPICCEMDHTTVPIGHPWTFPDGRQDMEPQGIHPQCRCTVALQEIAKK
ncbi:MAG: phage minor head protein [Acidobacteria bacterium]|nr:phage minor head protein [Acidobacteriota bacterium]